MWLDALDELRGRRVLITGASSGISAATARALIECGATVAMHYSSNRANAERLVAEFRRQGGDALALHADLACRVPARRSPRLRSAPWAASTS